MAFDGDCTQVLSSAELDGFLGEGWLTREERDAEYDTDRRHPAFALAPLETIGGVECDWFAAEEKGGLQGLSIMIAPADSVPESFTEAFSEARCEGNYDGSSCYLVRTEGDAWLMATVGNLIDEPPVAMLEDMLDAAAAHLPQPLDAQAVSRDGWWTLPTCEDFGEQMRLEELIGRDYVTGFWEGSESPEMIMLREGGVAVLCEWSTTDPSTSYDGGHHVPAVHIANGGQWLWDDLGSLPGAEEIAVPGAEGAVLVPTPDGRLQYLFATDGVNLIETNGSDTEFLVMLAERALAALG